MSGMKKAACIPANRLLTLFNYKFIVLFYSFFLRYFDSLEDCPFDDIMFETNRVYMATISNGTVNEITDIPPFLDIIFSNIKSPSTSLFRFERILISP